MLGGRRITETTRAHAREMIEAGRRAEPVRPGNGGLAGGRPAAQVRDARAQVPRRLNQGPACLTWEVVDKTSSPPPSRMPRTGQASR